jgi:hypothetical protein
MSPGRTLPSAALLMLLAFGAGCSGKSSAPQVQAWNAELARLQAEQDSLRAREVELLDQDPRIHSLPVGDVVVCVPTKFVRSVIERVFADVVDDVTLSLGGIKTRVARKVKKGVTIGEFVLDVEIDEVIGRLQPGQPDVRFGENRVSMSLPVTLSEGHGAATLHFVWDGKHVAGLTCGDLDITQKVSGKVIPTHYRVEGRLDLTNRGNELICTPVFPETKLRIRVKPSQESWTAVNTILAEKRGVCGWVLDKVNIPGLLEGIVQDKGFNVKLPFNRLKPFALPAGVRDSVTVAGKLLTFETRTNTLRLDPDAIWYSATVDVKSH